MSDGLIRGDNYSWTIVFTDENGQPADLAGMLIWLTAKPTASDLADDSDAVISHAIQFDAAGNVVYADGMYPGRANDVGVVTPLPASDGVLAEVLTEAEITLLSAITAPLKWDLQIKRPNDVPTGWVKTLLSGNITVEADTTRRETMP